MKVPRNFQGASFAAALFFLFVHVQGQWIYCNRAGETFAEVDVRNTFFLLAESHSPVLVTFSDAEVLGALYGQHILGLGKNVVVVQPAMWPRDTYRWAILEKLGLDLHPNPKFQEDWKVAIQATSVDKDIYFSRLADELKQGWPPQLIRRVRLVRWYRNPLPIDESAMVNRDLASFSYGLERPLGGTPLSAWEASLYARYHEWFQAVASRIQKKP